MLLNTQNKHRLLRKPVSLSSTTHSCLTHLLTFYSNIAKHEIMENFQYGDKSEKENVFPPQS